MFTIIIIYLIKDIMKLMTLNKVTVSFMLETTHGTRILTFESKIIILRKIYLK